MDRLEDVSLSRYCIHTQRNVIMRCTFLIREEIRHGVSYEIGRKQRRTDCEYSRDCGANHSDCKYAVPFRRDITTKDYLNLS